MLDPIFDFDTRLIHFMTLQCEHPTSSLQEGYVRHDRIDVSSINNGLEDPPASQSSLSIVQLIRSVGVVLVVFYETTSQHGINFGKKGSTYSSAL